MTEILVTPRSFASTSRKPDEMLEEKGYQISRNTTGRPLKKNELLELTEDAAGIIVGIDKLDAEIIKKAENLRVISKYGVGLDNIDLEEARNRGIVVTNTPNANNEAVADLAFGHILSLARRIPEADRKTKAGQWEKIIGNSVWNKTIGIIGLGGIGKQVVKRADGFNMEILAFDTVKDEQFAREFNVRYVSFKQLLKRSDYLSIHTPLNEETRGMFSDEEFKMMKETAYVINTSRGGIIDEDSLYRALKNKEIKGAGLDAYENEPPEDSPLKDLDNIIMTSHNGAYTEEAIASMGIRAAQNLIDVLEGREPDNRIC